MNNIKTTTELIDEMSSYAAGLPLKLRDRAGRGLLLDGVMLERDDTEQIRAVVLQVGSEPAAVREPEPAVRERVYTHPIRFRFGDFGAQPYGLMANRITDWLTATYRKTTNRAFVYESMDSAGEPPTVTRPTQFPSEDFPVDLYIVPGKPTERGYYLIGDEGQTIAVVRVPTPEVNQWLLCCCAHEIAHGFGAGIGEPYGSRVVQDMSGTWPTLKVNAMLAQDDYWHDPGRADWLNDPLLNYEPTEPRFSNLSSLVINKGTWRKAGPPLPSMVRLQVPANSHLVVWNPTETPNTFFEARADESGSIVFQNPMTAGQDQFRIVKVYPPSGWPFARGISIWDLELGFLTYGEDYCLNLI